MCVCVCVRVCVYVCVCGEGSVSRLARETGEWARAPITRTPPVLGHQGQQHPFPSALGSGHPSLPPSLGRSQPPKEGGAHRCSSSPRSAPPRSFTLPAQEYPHSCLTPSHQRQEAVEVPPQMQGLVPGKPGATLCGKDSAGTIKLLIMRQGDAHALSRGP